MKQSISDQNEFIILYQDKLTEYYKTRARSDDQYSWLMKSSQKMQSISNKFGTRFQYQPIGASYIHTNYQLFLNFVPELRDELLTSTGRLATEVYNRLNDTLLKLNGQLEQLQKSPELSYSFANLYPRGIKRIIRAPIGLLKFFGIINQQRYDTLATSKSYDLVSRILALLSIVATIMSIFIDWSEFIQLFTPGG